VDVAIFCKCFLQNGAAREKKWEIEIYEGGIKVGKINIFPEGIKVGKKGSKFKDFEMMEDSCC